MIEIGTGLYKQHASEIVSVFIATAAMVNAALAHKVARQAIHAARESNMTEFRLKVQTPSFTGQPALPFEIHGVCGSKMENTFSCCEIVSPLQRRRAH